MDQTGKTSAFEGAGARQGIGWIIIAVILGEATWALIVSVMNNLVVPWLGDVMGQSSGLPTSFTQRPYNYPDLFVSVLEFCTAGLVTAILNYFFQRPAAERVKPIRSSASMAPVEPIRIGPEATSASLQASSPSTLPVSGTRPETVPSTPFGTPGPVARPAAVAPQAPQVGNPALNPLPPAPDGEATNLEPRKLGQSKIKKPMLYNIVGEPVASDED